MPHKHPKTTNALLKYLRDSKGISVEGSGQKRKLMNIGYYHGYKGYRYIRKASNTIPYTDFNQLIAIYDFDTQLKTMFYPFVMQIETALKNYVLESVVSIANTESFVDIYGSVLDNYKAFSTTGKSYPSQNARQKAEDKYKNEIKRRLDLRNRIYKVQTDAFSKGNKIAVHYLRQDINLPIWAIFELLSLGEFGYFVSCLNLACRQDVSKRLGIEQNDDTSAMMPQRLIYATKDLRNAIAHNDVIFDTRFCTGQIDKQVKNVLTNATGVPNITFTTITDYLVLISYQLKLLHIPKTEMKHHIITYTECTEKLRKAIPINIFNQIIHTDNNLKVNALKNFVSK